MRNYLVLFFIFSFLSHCFCQVQVQQNVGNQNVASNQVQQNQGSTSGIQVQQNVGNQNVAQNQVQQNIGNQGVGNQGQGNQGPGGLNQGNAGQNNQGPQGSNNQGWNQNPGNWNQNPGNWNQNQGNWNQNQGNWNQNQGNWNQNQGNWNQNQGNNVQQSGDIDKSLNAPIMNIFNSPPPPIRQNLNVGNPDRGNITRPCPSYDINCIRKYFAENSYCKPSYGQVPEPYYRKKNVLYLPRINVTAELLNEKITGLSQGRIEDFYINVDTDKLVLVIEYRGLSFESNQTYIRIHRRAREPIIVKTTISTTYKSLVITTIIPQIYKLRLDKAVVFAFVNDPAPEYKLGSNFLLSNDPQVKKTAEEFPLNPRANSGESLLTSATFLPTTFIQYHICDFGLKLL